MTERTKHIDVTLDRDDAEAIAKDDFAFATDQANRLLQMDTPEASAMGRIIETIVEEIDIHLTTTEEGLSPDTVATLEVVKMLEQRRN